MLMLSQAIRRLGKPALPLPPFGVAAFGSAVRQARRADFSREQVTFLTHGRGVDNTRMRTELGFEPAYTTEQAFAEFATALRPGPLRADRVRAAETTLVGALTGGRGGGADG
jgi:UDP-glucose 4-epimerase